MSQNNTITMDDYTTDLYLDDNQTSHSETVRSFQNKTNEAMMCHLENLVNTYGRDEVITMIQRLKLTRKTRAKKAS